MLDSIRSQTGNWPGVWLKKGVSKNVVKKEENEADRVKEKKAGPN